MENAATLRSPLGPWDGIDERPNAPASKLRDGLNIVFRDGLVSRRPGRTHVAADLNGRRVAGLHEYVNEFGVRKVVAYMDEEPGGYTPGGLVELNWNTGALTEIAGPADVQPVPDGEFSISANIDGHLVIAEPGGKLLDFDGYTLSLLAAVAGIDAGVAAETYLSSPPGARFLAVWRDRLIAAGDPNAPRLIGLSENKWATANIPDTAPIGGANVWPVRTNFDLTTEEGDIVVNVTVLADRLVVLGRTGVAVVDEDSVAPYARIVARQHGCIAPRSVVNVGDRVFYLGEGAIYSFRGDGSQVISAPLSRTMSEVIDWDQAYKAVAVNLRRAREYRIWVPVRGRLGNCLIFNYEKNSWTKWAHWYPFDHNSRWSASAAFNVTAALATVQDNGRELLITGDDSGNFWLEDVGETDDQAATSGIFPAFLALPPLDRGSEVETYDDWMVDCLHDGCHVAGIGVVDGRSYEQEIVRWHDGSLTGASTDDIPLAMKRAVKPDQATWDAAPSDWPVTNIGPVMDELRLGMRQRARKIQPVICLRGTGPNESGTWRDDSAPGAIRQVEIGTRPRAGRR